MAKSRSKRRRGASISNAARPGSATARLLCCRAWWVLISYASSWPAGKRRIGARCARRRAAARSKSSPSTPSSTIFYGWLMRCDRVGFPKGGVAYTHVHQGPGIRYCLEGGIRIESEGAVHEYRAGEAWFESGAAPVLAPTSQESETSFIRCFVLPRGCKGRSSIRYVRPEDASRPKPQRYTVLGERFVALPSG